MNTDLQRVTSRIGSIITKFYVNSLKNNNPEFFAEELRELVASMVGKVAPGSTDRILRDLRQKNAINYIVLSRSQSLYKFIPTVDGIDLGNEVAEILTAPETTSASLLYDALVA